MIMEHSRASVCARAVPCQPGQLTVDVPLTPMSISLTPEICMLHSNIYLSYMYISLRSFYLNG